MATCEFCGKRRGVKLIDLGDPVYICEDCLNDNYIQCDRCGNWNDPTCVKYHRLITGEYVCPDCYNPETDKVRY